jgi:FtsZ-interacting cell division protein ZipA
VSGISLATVGTILLVVGVIGLVISLLFLSAWSRRRDGAVVRDRYVERDPIA